MTAQLTRASGQLSFWNFQGTSVGLCSDRGGGQEPTQGSHSPPGSSWVSCPLGRSSVVTEDGLVSR